jgi:hypothetical protein
MLRTLDAGADDFESIVNVRQVGEHPSTRKCLVDRLLGSFSPEYIETTRCQYNGPVYSRLDVTYLAKTTELLDFHMRHGTAGTMAVRLRERQHPFAVVRAEGVDISKFDEEPVSRSHINAGIYPLDASALEVLSTGEPCDMPTLFTRLCDLIARSMVSPMHEPWLDVGRPRQYDDANGYSEASTFPKDRSKCSR